LRAGTDYVLIARHSVLGAEFASLAADLQKAMHAVHKKLDIPLPPKKFGHNQQN
jgi:RNase P protein component